MFGPRINLDEIGKIDMWKCTTKEYPMPETTSDHSKLTATIKLDAGTIQQIIVDYLKEKRNILVSGDVLFNVEEQEFGMRDTYKKHIFTGVTIETEL